MTDDQPEDDAPRPSLRADGALERPPDQAVVPAVVPLPVVALAEAPLELAERAPPPLPEEPPPASEAPADGRRRWGRLVVGAALLVAALLVGGAVIASQRAGPRLPDPGAPLGVRPREQLEGLLAPSPTEALFIESVPSGATVTVGERVVGQTPWVGDSFGAGVEVVVSLPGYRPARVTLAGGPDERLRLKLQR